MRGKAGRARCGLSVQARTGTKAQRGLPEGPRGRWMPAFDGDYFFKCMLPLLSIKITGGSSDARTPALT